MACFTRYIGRNTYTQKSEESLQLYCLGNSLYRYTMLLKCLISRFNKIRMLQSGMSKTSLNESKIMCLYSQVKVNSTGWKIRFCEKGKARGKLIKYFRWFSFPKRACFQRVW